MTNVPISDDPNELFHIRWRGRQEGPFTAKVIEEKLASNQIGMLHEISQDGQWVSLRDYMTEREANLRAVRQAQLEEEERQRLEAEQQARQLEEQQKSEQVAEQRRLEAKAEASRHTAQTQPIQGQQSAGGSSGLRRVGILLLLAGLLVTAFFFFGFDTSVESGLGRVNNLGLMADRQNGILIGLGLAIVGTIMLVIGSRD
jgi:hypothetical protein